VDEVTREASVSKKTGLGLHRLHDEQFGAAPSRESSDPSFREIRTELAEKDITRLERVA
jgi:hypothetical protein